MSDLEMLFRLIVISAFGIFLIRIIGPDAKPINESKYSSKSNYSDNSKKYKELEKLTLNLESLKIKKEELENEIDKLSFDGSISFEKEKENNTKIKKLKLEVKHLDIKIGDFQYKIDNINREIQGISMY